jgi:hypothetical protein
LIFIDHVLPDQCPKDYLKGAILREWVACTRGEPGRGHKILRLSDDMNVTLSFRDPSISSMRNMSLETLGKLGGSASGPVIRVYCFAFTDDGTAEINVNSSFSDKKSPERE